MQTILSDTCILMDDSKITAARGVNSHDECLTFNLCKKSEPNLVMRNLSKKAASISESGESMLFLHCLNADNGVSCTLSIQVNKNVTIGDLKKQFQVKCNIPVKCQKIFWDSCELCDDSLISAAKMMNIDAITVNLLENKPARFVVQEVDL